MKEPTAREAAAQVVSSAWQDVRKRAVAADREAIEPLRAWLGTQTNAHAAVLSGRPAAGPANEQSARELEALLAARLARGELSSTTIAQQLSLLHRVGKRVRAASVELSPTCISSIPRPCPSPFPADTADALAKVALWTSALDQLIVDGIPSELLWPAALLSSILNGGLLDVAKLKNLRTVLAQRGRSSLSASSGDGHAYIEFLLPFSGFGNHHLQRWHVDPVTELLLIPMRGAQPLPDWKNTRSPVRDALIRGGVPSERLPKSISDLLSCARIWWAVRGAPVDLHAMDRTFAAHDLTTRCWNRISGPTQPGQSRGSRRTGGGARPAPPGAESEAELFAATSSEHEWLAELRAMLEQADISSAIEAVGRYFDGLDESDYRRPYVGWLRAALSVRPKSAGIVPKLPVLKLPFLLAAPRLLNYLGERRPELLDVAELDEVYRVILDGCDPQEPIERIARGLRMFHDYLVKHHGRPRLVDPRQTFGEGGSLMPVDATVITVDEYLAAQAGLERRLQAGADPRDTGICRLVLVLAFRVGLRRGEIFGLRLRDLQDHRGLYLQVRRYGVRTLKTANATRTLRIDPLLCPQERKLLREWISRRHAEENGEPSAGDERSASGLLFAAPGRGMDGVSVQGVVGRTLEVLREVTGEPRLHLHHLRHSCATWLWLKLRAADYPTLPPLLASMPALCGELKTAKRLRVLLCGAVSGPSRSYTYVLARVLGHSSPATTLAHYLHVDDLFRAATMHRALADKPMAVWQALTGASQTTVYEWRSRSGIHGVAVGARAFGSATTGEVTAVPALAAATGEVACKGVRMPRKRTPANPPRATCEGLMGRVSGALNLYNSLDPDLDHQTRLDTVARQCGVPSSDVSAWIRNAHALAKAFDLHVPPRKADGPGVLRARGNLVPAPPVGIHASQAQTMNYAAGCLERAASRSMARTVAALNLVLTRLNARRHDVVFRGAKDRKAARLFMEELHRAGLSSDRLQLVVRRQRADDTALPDWFRPPHAQNISVKRVPPSGSKPEQAAAYAGWVGVRLRSEDGRCHASAWRNCLFLACVAFGVSCEGSRQAS